MNILFLESWFKNTRRDKAPSNKSPTLSKSMNINIQVVGIST